MLDRTCLQHPKKRVVLITFNNDVTVFGDGSQEPQVMTGDSLNDYDKIVSMGAMGIKYSDLKPLSESHAAINKRIEELQEEGATALGPALLLAASIASQRSRSEIIVCTDGFPNVGVGSLDGENQTQANEFYIKAGTYAKSNNTSISVLGIEGAGGALGNLSTCAEMTSGTVHILNPFELARQIRKLTQNPVVATNLQVNIVMHPDLMFGPQDCKQELSSMSKEIANARSDSDLTFEFTIRARAKNRPLAMYPFQIQTRYTRLDGVVCLRVISIARPSTTNRGESEKNCNVSLVGLSAIQHAATLADDGELRSARLKLDTTQRLFQRAAKSDTQKEEFSNFLTQRDIFDRELQNAIKKGSPMDDNTTKTIFSMKVASRVLFLAGNKKNLEKRKGDPLLSKQYYDIHF